MEVLTNLIERLEVVADQLEIAEANKEEETDSQPKIIMPPVLTDFDKIVSGSLANYFDLSSKLGGDVEKQAALVRVCFEDLRALIHEASRCSKPSDPEMANKLKSLVDSLTAVVKLKDDNRGSKQINHLSGIAEAIPALGWVTMPPKPAQYIKDMAESGQFYFNRVIKDFKGNDETQVEWARSFSSVIGELEKYVNLHHTTGLNWSGSERSAAGGVPPPPPPPPPSFSVPSNNGGDTTRAALFSEINKGSSVTSGLRKVTDDMKTHKNPNLRAGNTVSGEPGQTSNPPPVAAKPKVRPSVFELRGNKWCVENFNGKSDIVVEPQELKESVYIYNCNDCCIQINGKLNSIVLDSCKKTGIVFDSVISCVDIINCRSVQAQVRTKVASINIDKTDGVQIYVNEDSKDVEIVYAKSSEMNLIVPSADGDFVEHPIPEQFKCKFDGSKVHSEPNKSC